MKSNFKRIIAILCALVLGISSVSVGEKFTVQASEGVTAYTPTEAVSLVNSAGTGIYWNKSDLGFTAPVQESDELALCMKVNVSDANAIQVLKSCTVELAQSGMDVAELEWTLGNENIYVGENTIYLYFKDAKANSTDITQQMNLNETINWFRIFSGTTAESFSVTLSEISLVEKYEAGLTFGETDTYLQLSNKLGETPKTIEASVKGMKTEWTIKSADAITHANSHGVTTATDAANNGPDAGTPYAEYTNYTGYVLNKDKNEADYTSVAPDFGSYTKDDLALSFWYYTDTAGTLPGAQIELGSHETTTDNYEICWTPSKTSVQAGWNYVELPLGEWDEANATNLFEVQNLVRIRWYGASANTFKITDLKIVPYEAKEWTIIPASKFNNVDTNVARVEGGPDTTWNVANISSTTGWPVATTFTTPNIGEYDEEDLVLAFWYYSYATDATRFPSGGAIELTSAGTWDKQSIRWLTEAMVVYPGWNYIELPLSCYNTIAGTETFNVKNMNCIRWFGMTEGTHIQVSDMRIVVKEAANNSWTLYDNTGDAAGSKIGSLSGSPAFPISGTTFEKIPELQYETTQDLALSFWIYSYSAGNLPSGIIALSSQSNPDNYCITKVSNEISVEAGWNHIVLPLSSMYDGSRGFVLQDLNYIRWWVDAGSGWEYQLSKIELVDLGSHDVAVTQSVNDTTLDASMIFSNTNSGTEESAYALFITKEGYPSLLYGTTQYTLEYPLSTEEWVDLAVSVADNGVAKFYVDGVMVGRSAAVTKETLTFSTPHCIGADGSGSNMIDGTIADVRLWNDVRTSTEIKENLKSKNNTKKLSGIGLDGMIGSWFLYGDIQYILEEMPDLTVLTYNEDGSVATTGSKNPAVFRGSRADDWYDYDISKHDFLWEDKNESGTYDAGEENYWSLVFIPDIQNLTTGSTKATEIWGKMSDWIASNVVTENIKFVIGAGDTTWSNTENEYNIAMTGFDKFRKLVPFSNLIGNHDYTWKDANGNKLTYRESSMFQKYFGLGYMTNSENVISTLEWGYYNDERGESSTSLNTVTTTENSYYRFKVGNTPWMILQLEFHPRMSVIQWADDILKQYPNDNVILATHSYIEGNASYLTDSGMTYLSDGTQGDYTDYSDTTGDIWEELKDNSNIKMILCGHATSDTGAIVCKEETNDLGRTVKALLLNAQDLDASEPGTDTAYYTGRPVGMLSILRFSEDGQEVAVDYYAPEDDKSFNPIDAPDSEERTTKDVRLEYGVGPDVVEYDNGAKPGKAPSDAVDYYNNGYVFAGWYTDEACTKVLKAETANAVYAKYVSKEVLQVQAQVRLDETTNTVPTDKTDIRFATTVNSLKYQEVGFEITIGTTTKPVSATDVYPQVYAIGKAGQADALLTLTPYGEFNLQSNYFYTYTLFNVPSSAYDTEIQVRAYWKTQDGTTVWGETTTKKVADFQTALSSN